MMLIDVRLVLRPIGRRVPESYPAIDEEVAAVELALAAHPCFHSFLSRVEPERHENRVRIDVRCWADDALVLVDALGERVAGLPKAWELAGDHRRNGGPVLQPRLLGATGAALLEDGSVLAAPQAPGGRCADQADVDERLTLVRQYQAVRRACADAEATRFFSGSDAAVEQELERCGTEMRRLNADPVVGALFAYAR